MHTNGSNRKPAAAALICAVGISFIVSVINDWSSRPMAAGISDVKLLLLLQLPNNKKIFFFHKNRKLQNYQIPKFPTREG